MTNVCLWRKMITFSSCVKNRRVIIHILTKLCHEGQLGPPWITKKRLWRKIITFSKCVKNRWVIIFFSILPKCIRPKMYTPRLNSGPTNVNNNIVNILTLLTVMTILTTNLINIEIESLQVPSPWKPMVDSWSSNPFLPKNPRLVFVQFSFHTKVCRQGLTVQSLSWNKTKYLIKNLNPTISHL